MVSFLDLESPPEVSAAASEGAVSEGEAPCSLDKQGTDKEEPEPEEDEEGQEEEEGDGEGAESEGDGEMDLTPCAEEKAREAQEKAADEADAANEAEEAADSPPPKSEDKPDKVDDSPPKSADEIEDDSPPKKGNSAADYLGESRENNNQDVDEGNKFLDDYLEKHPGEVAKVAGCRRTIGLSLVMACMTLGNAYDAEKERTNPLKILDVQGIGRLDKYGKQI